MSESHYISTLRRRWPREAQETSPETIALADEAVAAFPASARLWVIRGNLIELSSDLCPYALEDALACFRRAVEVDPQFEEAWEEIGHFYDAVLDDEAAAQRYFEQAARLREAKRC
jgi:tetratricopeptide (TPR) repeat protein